MSPLDAQAVSKSLESYRQLLEKVEAKFGEIYSRQSSRMNCAKGCHSCCLPELTVFTIEKENLRHHINSTSGLEAALLALANENPHQGKRCSFLKADGACAVYEARPLVCRSHGAPIFFKLDDVPQTDVCPLNFSDLKTLSELSGQEFINLDLLNTILAALNGQIDQTGQRHNLKLGDLLKP